MKVLLLFAAAGVFAGCSRGGARSAVATADAPAAIGPYSQAILAGGAVYVSGQIALDPRSGKMAAEDIRGQTAQVIRNLTAVLHAAGYGLDDTVFAQVYLADLGDYAAMNEIYGGAFKSPPARATVQVARLPRDARVEISLIAARAN